nr:cysteine protease domain-containing protein [Fusarium asiaticum vivivirus 1]
MDTTVCGDFGGRRDSGSSGSSVACDVEVSRVGGFRPFTVGEIMRAYDVEGAEMVREGSGDACVIGCSSGVVGTMCKVLAAANMSCDVAQRFGVGTMCADGSVDAFGDGFPLCLDADDAAAVLACLMIVSRGAFRGSGYAELMHRAEIRCEVARSVCEDVAEMREAAVICNEIVRGIERELGYRTSFVDDVADMVMVCAMCVDDKSVRRAGVLGSDLAAVLVPKAAGRNTIVTRPVKRDELRFGPTWEDFDQEMVVLPLPVYRALMSVSAEVVSGTVFVSVRQRVDGIHVFGDRYDASCGYAVSSIPQGKYELPGSYGLVVDAHVMMSYLVNVLVLPRMAKQDGYCYINCMPLISREESYKVLGSNPRVYEMAAFAPSIYDWSEREAVLKAVGSRESVTWWHVVSGGSLPTYVAAHDRVGVYNVSDNMVKDAAAMLDDMLGAAGRGGPTPVPSVGRFSPPRVPQSPPRVGASYVPSVVGSSVSSVSGFESSHARSMSESYTSSSRGRVAFPMGMAPVYMPQWEAVEDPVQKTWVNRLSSGPPVGVSVLLSMSRGKMLYPEQDESGSSVLVRNLAYPPGNTLGMAGWERRERFPVKGWNLDVFEVKKGSTKDFLCVLPVAGILCRYEFDFERPVCLNDSVTISGNGVVAWCGGDMKIRTSSCGKVVRIWSVDGATSLGTEMTTLSAAFGALAVRGFGNEITTERVIGLEMANMDPNSGMVQYVKKFRMKSSERVHFYVRDDVVGQPVLFELQGVVGSVQTHGTKVNVADGCATFVVYDSQATFKISLHSVGKGGVITAKMSYVRDFQRFEGVISGKVNYVDVGNRKLLEV